MWRRHHLHVGAGAFNSSSRNSPSGACAQCDAGTVGAHAGALMRSHCPACRHGVIWAPDCVRGRETIPKEPPVSASLASYAAILLCRRRPSLAGKIDLRTVAKVSSLGLLGDCGRGAGGASPARREKLLRAARTVYEWKGRQRLRRAKMSASLLLIAGCGHLEAKRTC